MSYSALVGADYRRCNGDFNAQTDIKDFPELLWQRVDDARVEVPKAMEAAFMQPQPTPQDASTLRSKPLRPRRQSGWSRDSSQRKRLADAERTLQTQPTKAAAKRRRIATDRSVWVMRELADLKRLELKLNEARIFPGLDAPAMLTEVGRRVLKPRRYQCRPAGKPVFCDTKYPFTYNARRDNLEGFWRDLSGFSQGPMVVKAFFENVNQHPAEGRERGDGKGVSDPVLECQLRPTQDTAVACPWSRWSAPREPELLSFAAIADDAPAKESAAGYDRCIIPIHPHDIDAWLSPDPNDLAAQCAAPDHRARPHCEARRAA